MQAVFAGGRVPTSAADVYGVVSLIVWTLTLVVTVKYVTFVMRADSDGEGGMMALIARVKALGLASRRARAGLKDKIVIFEITPESCMDVTNNYDCIAVTTGASAAGNITEATLHILQSYQSAVPAIAPSTGAP